MYYQHKFKHLGCSLHFVVCSDAEDWGDTHKVTCPECGRQEGGWVYWKEPVEGFIFETVPGSTPLVGFGDESLAY